MPPATTEQLIAFFISPSGRATRIEYLLGLGFIFFLNAAVINIVVMGMGIGAMPEFSTLMLISLPFIPSQILITIRRCHDLNLHGLFVLLFAVPMAGLILLVFLAIIPGNGGANRYGPPVRYHP